MLRRDPGAAAAGPLGTARSVAAVPGKAQLVSMEAMPATTVGSRSVTTVFTLSYFLCPLTPQTLAARHSGEQRAGAPARQQRVPAGFEELRYEYVKCVSYADGPANM